ncbi:hypothetical protein [Microcoleus sp. S13_C5]|uniref:hypothetical protein n=1 Tax=Microcoleus sp. S13_C5 TaxID=3055411 RepID=UPI002FD390B9
MAISHDLFLSYLFKKVFGLCLNIKPKLAHSQTIFGYSWQEVAVIAEIEGKRKKEGGFSYLGEKEKAIFRKGFSIKNVLTVRAVAILKIYLLSLP